MATEIRATVFTIESIKPHSNADKLEVVTALGWQVVTAKGLHKVGDRCVYIQPNSLIPDVWSEKWGVKAYLKGPEHNRVGQIRLRGEPSFGFIVGIPDGDWKDGDNLSDFFGIQKYEPPIKTTCGDAEKDHPLFPQYTHIENLRNFPDVFIPGEEIVATEKIHGTSSRSGSVENELMAGSMELRRKRPENEENWKSNTYWFPLSLPAIRNMIETEGKLHKQFIVFGEVYGSNIQKDYNYDTHGHVGFKVFDILIDGKYLSYDDATRICKEYGVEIVPLLYRGPFSLEAIKKIADGPTTLGNGHIREGTVVRPIKERRHPQVGRLVMKYVGAEYILSKHPDSKDV